MSIQIFLLSNLLGQSDEILNALVFSGKMTDISTFIFILRGLLNRYGFENFSILFIYISNIGKNHFCKKIF